MIVNSNKKNAPIRSVERGNMDIKIVEVKEIGQEYIQHKSICKAYDLSRSEVDKLIQKMKSTAKYEHSFVALSHRCKLVKYDDWKEFFQSLHLAYLK